MAPGFLKMFFRDSYALRASVLGRYPSTACKHNLLIHNPDILLHLSDLTTVRGGCRCASRLKVYRMSRVSGRAVNPSWVEVPGSNMQGNVQLACQACFQQFKTNQNCELATGTKPSR